jgi:hypothetical protein
MSLGPHGDVVEPPEDDEPFLARAKKDLLGRNCPACHKPIEVGQLVQFSSHRHVVRHAGCVAKLVNETILGRTRPGLRVAVTGGRAFASPYLLARCLTALGQIGVLAHGGAVGADLLAGRWARQHDIPVRVYPADWGARGPRAGPERNRRMLQHFAPDLLVAFTGGVGTLDCMGAARARGIPVWETWATKKPPLLPTAATGSSVTCPTS